MTFATISAMISLPVLWLITLVVFGLLEAATVSLVSIWFATGALVALLVSLFADSFIVQLVVFLLVSLITLALVRPVAKKYFSPRLRTTNSDRLIGMDAIVTEPIDNLAASGQVKVAGQIWTARSEFEATVPVGTTVTILRIEGVKMIVQVKKPVIV